MGDFTKRELEILDVVFDKAYTDLLTSVRMIAINKVVSEEMAETAKINQKLADEFEGISNKIDRLRQEFDDEDLR
jgi:hypothetical protein